LRNQAAVGLGRAAANRRAAALAAALAAKHATARQPGGVWH